MKTTLTLHQFRKCIIAFIAGVACSSLASLIYVTNPVDIILQYNLEMRPNSLIYNIFNKLPLDIYVKVYVFNITNTAEFLSGKEKLRVQEVGPYIYQEYLENINITFNDNNTMTFVPRRKVIFRPELSIGDPKKHFIQVPNVVYLGATSSLHDSGFLLNYPLIRLANMLNTEVIFNISVHEFLWGYDDSMVRLASGIVPNFINFQKLGIMDRMYDEGENIITVNLKKTSDLGSKKEQYFSIDKWNGNVGLNQWGYVNTEDNTTREENTICNTLQGTTEGIIFPTNVGKDVEFRIYRKTFCRALPIQFKKEVLTKDGIPAYYYVLKDDFAETPDKNPDNKCYCLKKPCLKKGLINIKPCTYNLPIAMSAPHFLNADPSLLEDIDGLHPDEEKHGSYIMLQPKIGLPVSFISQMQTNLIMYNTHYNAKITPFNNKVIPLIWFGMYMKSLTKRLIFTLKLITIILPKVQTTLIYLLNIVGITIIVWSFGRSLRLCNERRSKKKREVPERVDPDLKIPLCNVKRNSLGVFPTLQKIRSKTEVFS